MNKIEWPFGSALSNDQEDNPAAKWAVSYSEKMKKRITESFEKSKNASSNNTSSNGGDYKIITYILEKLKLIKKDSQSYSWDDSKLEILLRGTRQEVIDADLYQRYIDLVNGLYSAVDKCHDKVKANDKVIRNYPNLEKYLSNNHAHELRLLGKLIKLNSHYVTEYYANHTTKKKDSRDFRNALINTFQKPLEKIFNYEKWIKNDEREKIIKFISVVKCPYCDRNYIANVSCKNEKIQATADLDHYHIKSRFPLFALSLFNLIPACHTCNSTFKGSQTASTTYPYDIDYQGYAHFQTKASFDDKLKLLQGYSDVQFDIELKPDDKIASEIKDAITKDCEVFKLQEVYALHKNLVRDLYWRSKIYYSDGYITHAENLLQNSSIEKDITWFLYGYDAADDGQDHENTLSKFRRDIIKEIEEIYRTMHDVTSYDDST